MNPVHVVKLGGSLLQEPRVLRDWLDAIAAAGCGRIVVVPGGGPFADAVRNAQAELGFDDRAAHRMALLAMEQFGLALAGLEPACVPAHSTSAIRQALGERRVPIWMPSRIAERVAGIPESWDVTSDSLAAWLARTLGASMLWLVKVRPVPVQSLDRLALMGVVDRGFPRFCRDAPFAVRVVGPDDTLRLTATLAEDGLTPAPAGVP